jgi:FkbM family methyltransferase
MVPRAIGEMLLRAAALAPPAIKGPLFERVCARLRRLSRADTTSLTQTNLGLSSKLRFAIPIAKTAYAFGRPGNITSEKATVVLVRELARDCRHFVDVGANEGIYTVLASQVATTSPLGLHWFEPDRDLYARVAANLAANEIDAHGNALAVSDRKGSAIFRKNLSDDASGSLTDLFTKTHRTSLETVDTVTLSDYLVERNIHDAFVKIDVEGSGHDAWVGARAAAHRIKYLIVEMLAPEIDKGLPATIIADTGFRAYYIHGFELEESTDGTFRYVEPFWNWLFCRLDPVQLSHRLVGTKCRVVIGFCQTSGAE